jgi:glycine reductase
MVPVLLHPNEWLDGALVTSHSSRGVETYFYQKHPVLTALYRWHREGKITLVGTIATMAGSDNDDRPRNCMLAAQQAKWALGADGVILTKYGGGAPHADMALTARLCEQFGMRTTVQVECWLAATTPIGRSRPLPGPLPAIPGPPRPCRRPSRSTPPGSAASPTSKAPRACALSSISSG